MARVLGPFSTPLEDWVTSIPTEAADETQPEPDSLVTSDGAASDDVSRETESAEAVHVSRETEHHETVDVSRETSPLADESPSDSSSDPAVAPTVARSLSAYTAADTDDDFDEDPDGGNRRALNSDATSDVALPPTAVTPLLSQRSSDAGSLASASESAEFDPLLEDTPIARAAQQAVDVQQGDLTLPRPRHRRVFTVANQKGGVGKTTTAVNIGVALALAGLHVLVVDLDPQGNSSTALGAERSVGTPSIYEVLLGEIEAAEAIQTCPDAPRLGILPATIDLAGAEIELVTMERRETRLRAAIDAIKGEYDYVFIDCPPSLGLLTVNAMTATEEVLIPIQCEYYALEGVGQLLNNIGLIQQHLNTTLEVSTVLLTMYDGRTKLADQVASEVRKHFGDKVLRTVIPRSVKVSEAPGFSQSVMTYDAGSRGAMAYLDAAREIAYRGARPVEPAKPAVPAESHEPVPSAGSAPKTIKRETASIASSAPPPSGETAEQSPEESS